MVYLKTINLHKLREISKNDQKNLFVRTQNHE